MTKTTLYRLYDQDDALLYVGISLNWAKRVREHTTTKDWWPEVATMKVEELPDREVALAAEAHAISTEKPRYNGVPGRKPNERRQPKEEHQHTFLGSYGGWYDFWCPYQEECDHPDQRFVDYPPPPSPSRMAF